MRSQNFKTLFLIAAAAAAAYLLYPYFKPADKYEYWNALIAKDPKPFWVSEKEYREKLRAGYCWRDRKFYTAEELQPKAMVGFAGRLLGEAEAYRTDQTTNQGGQAYTSADCRRYEDACKVWFIEQGYTNDEWRNLIFTDPDPLDGKLMSKYPKKEIKKPEDLQEYMGSYGSKEFTLRYRYYEKMGESIYGSDCCKVMDKQEAEPEVKNNTLITYLDGASIFPENDIPKGIDIADYGVGNFYLRTEEVILSEYIGLDKDKKNIYKKYSGDIFLMNNCGDILWQPYY